MSVDLILFWLVGSVAVASALGVILHPHPVYSALLLVVALFQVAVLFVLLDAHMIAFLQVIVYAGAIMVLFLFVIMLLNLEREQEPSSGRWRALVFGAGGVLTVELVVLLLRGGAPAGGGPILDEAFGGLTALGRSLFTDHVFAFELAGILLLLATVGAVVLARKRTFRS